MPPPQHPTDKRINQLFDAFGGGGGGGGDEADQLLAAAADVARLEGGGGSSNRNNNEYDLNALAAGGDKDAKLVAPSKAELRGHGRDAAGALREVRHAQEAAASSSVGHVGSGSGGGYEEVEDDEVDEAERLLSMVQDEIDFEREEEKELAKARAKDCGPPVVVPVVQGTLIGSVKALPVPGSGGGGGGSGSAAFPSAPTHARGAHAVATTKPIKTEDSDGSDDMSRWCSICNEDAVLWCVGCDDDPYCKRCWREGHIDEDLRRHKTVAMAGRRRPR